MKDRLLSEEEVRDYSDEQLGTAFKQIREELNRPMSHFTFLERNTLHKNKHVIDAEFNARTGDGESDAYPGFQS